MKTNPTYKFGQMLLYQSPIYPELKTECVFIRHNNISGRAIVIFENAKMVASVDYEYLHNKPTSITKIDLKSDGTFNAETHEVEKTGYEMISRTWVTSDGEYIRDWTPDEYVNHNPEHNIIMPITIGERTVDVELHCMEIGNKLCYNSQRDLVMKFAETITYPTKN